MSITIESATMTTFKTLRYTLALTTTLTACGPIQDMKSMKSTTEHMDQTTSAMSSSTSQMAGTTETMVKNTESMLNKTTDMSDKMGTLVDSMTTMQTAISKMGNSIESMSDKMTSMSTDTHSMATQMNSMNTNMTGVRTDMSKMSGSVDKMAEKMDGMNLSLLGLYKYMESMSQDTHSMTTKMDSMNQNMTGVRDDMSKMSGSVDKMSGQMTTVASQMSTMNQSIVIMTNQMTGLSDHIQKMQNSLDIMNTNMTLIFSAQHRIESLDAMNRSDDQVTKLGYAAEYMISQTYQSWNYRINTPEYREELMAMSVEDFFYKIRQFITDRDKIDPTSTKNESMNLYALAATLDYVNLIELMGLDTNQNGGNQKVVSMLSMIEDGLRAKASLSTGKKLSDLPLYQQKVLAYENDAIYLLQIRHNFLKAIGLSLLESQENGDDAKKAKIFFDLLKINWKPDVSSKNSAETQVIATAFNLAADTEEFLISQKIGSKNYKLVKDFIKKARVNNPLIQQSIDRINQLH